ncbi:MAG: magnesium chelatase ATPase subunit I, partial [Pseudomonadota bacterium]
FSHPARFILVGTMNPEEGDLRPQLLDRFGLCVQVVGLHEKEQRMEILRRKAAFDSDPAAFGKAWYEQQQELAGKIVAARERLAAVELTDSALEKIVTITAALHLDGHRADIVIMKTSRALAAYRELGTIGDAEIRDAALIALTHRQKRLPFEEVGSERGKLMRVLDESLS